MLQNDKKLLTLPCVKGGGFALAKTEGLFWVYICVKKIYLIAKTIIYLQSPTAFAEPPLRKGALFCLLLFALKKGLQKLQALAIFINLFHNRERICSFAFKGFANL